MGKNRKKKKSQRDEDSNANADHIPENWREAVQRLKEMFNRSEQEIYLTLVECNMSIEEAINSLLSQDSFQEVKSKREKKKEAKEKSIMAEKDKESNVNADDVPEDMKEIVQTLKKLVNCSEQKIYTVLLECNMDADEAVNRLLSQDNIPADKREIVQKLKNIVNCSEQEIYAVLLECNMDADKAVDLLSQDNPPADMREIVHNMKKVVNYSEQEIQEELLECNMDADKAVNRLLSQDDLQEGSGNKFSSDGNETSNVQEIHNHLADSSTTSDNLGCEPPLNSDVSDVNTNKVPISLYEAVPSLAVSSSLGRGTNGQRTMADNVKMDLASSKENVTKAPEKPDVPNQFSNSSIDSAANRDQLQEPVSVSNQIVCNDDNGGSRLLSDNYDNKNDKTHQTQSFGQAVPSLSISSSLGYGTYGKRTMTDVVKMGLASSKENVTKALYPQYSASPLNQSMPSTSSLGRRLSVSMTEMNEQAISHHYSQPEVPVTVGPYGSAYGSTNGSALSSTYRSPSGSTYGSTNGSTYSSAHGSAYGSPSGAAYGSSMWSDNAANLRRGSNDDFSSQLANHLASLLQANGNSNVWDPQGQNDSGHSYYRLFKSRDQNQQSPSFRHIQQQQSPSFRHIQQQQQQQQQNNRRDPSKQTQKEPWPRNNY